MCENIQKDFREKIIDIIIPPFAVDLKVHRKNRIFLGEVTLIQRLEWLKPGLFGAAAGAIAVAIVGFSWGGWVSSETAKKMAADQARLEVVAALVPVCIEQSKQDPEMAEKLALLKDASNYRRSDLLMEAGWATMPGSTDPNRYVASACMKELASRF